MSVAFEPHVATRYLIAKLRQDVTLAGWFGQHVYDDLIPAGLTRYIRITFVNGEDDAALGSFRIWNDQLWQVEAWSRTNDNAVVAMYAAQIDTVLHRSSGTMTGTGYGDGDIWECTRERTLKLPPDVDESGVIWRRAGGEYRLYVTGA